MPIDISILDTLTDKDPVPFGKLSKSRMPMGKVDFIRLKAYYIKHRETLKTIEEIFKHMGTPEEDDCYEIKRLKYLLYAKKTVRKHYIPEDREYRPGVDEDFNRNERF